MAETETMAEVQANPYNAKNTGVQERPRGLMGANDSLAYSTPEPEAEQEEVEATTVTTEDDKLYTKVDYKKRYDDMKRHYDRKLTEWKAQQEELEARIAAGNPKKVPKTPEELATFKDEYPDVYDVVETVAHMQAAQELDTIKKEVSKLKEREQEIAYREAEMKLKELHPDFDEIRMTDEFHEWASKQPEVIQGWIYENQSDASLAARAIDLYKRDVNLVSEKQSETRTEQHVQQDAAEAVFIKDAVDPNAGQKKIWKSSEIERMSDAEFEANAHEIDEAFREGRIQRG